ncbi:alpha-galactosidase A precursor [Penicillium angulare]|uniref:Alpha-galactosidase A n=1 Tax=Penicillium angulare TaxID=116970 RepID=A0A9W9G8C6_9EURO|nr:alpha-galactosidase A precursor [Penicillium angulare]
MDNQPQIELPQAEVDENTQSFLRLLIDERSIKYITIDPGIYSDEDMCFGPGLSTVLPKFPPGDWNDGLVSKSPDSGQPYFASCSNTEFPGVENTWHEIFVDYMQLSIGRKLRTGIYEATCQSFSDTIVIKFARFEWELQYLENETTAYQWISGHDIGPRFLGHLTKNGRVIGFLMEAISNPHHATVDDLEACQDVLSRLHKLGIQHGDTNRFNFLVHDSGATLIDFDTSQRCDDQELLVNEFEGLSTRLNDSSGRGGGGLL